MFSTTRVVLDHWGRVKVCIGGAGRLGWGEGSLAGRVRGFTGKREDMTSVVKGSEAGRLGMSGAARGGTRFGREDGWEELDRSASPRGGENAEIGALGCGEPLGVLSSCENWQPSPRLQKPRSGGTTSASVAAWVDHRTRINDRAHSDSHGRSPTFGAV